MLALAARIHAARPDAVVIAAEHVSLMALDLPVRGRRQRLQSAPFALEDRLSEPLSTLHCALHPGVAAPGALVATVGVARMPAGGSGPVIPETMAIARPDADGTRATWAVWCAGERAVVRVSDGTGFAVGAPLLVPLWRKAGHPALIRLADPLPDPLAAQDMSSAPPPADPRDLAFDLRQGAFADNARDTPALLRVAAMAVGVGLVLHLGVAALDRFALARIAADAQFRTQALLDARLPGVPLSAGLPALVARLAPAPAAPPGSDFLPLLGATARAFLDDAPAAEMQRLSWDARSGDLSLDLTAGSLEDLQQIEQSLTRAGLDVTGGTATLQGGVARTDLRVGVAP